jgi:alkylation response protein AidB-like acyl-CoA dehydrogenase
MTTLTTTVEAARALAPLIREHADAIERERCLPEPVFRGLVEADLFRLLLPRVFGGAETDPPTVCRIVEEVSRIDGSTGWCVMIGNCNAHFAGLLPAEAAREIFTGPEVVVAGAFRPTGVAEVVDGGYSVTGRRPLGSGIVHSAWVLGACVVQDGDRPRLTASGRPEFRFMFFPKAHTEVIDTWHVAGLRGTGSHDYQVSDLFVPAHRAFWFSEEPVQPGPLYTLPAIAIFAAYIGCVSLGIARHAVDAFKELAAVKTPTRSTTVLREKPVAQAQIGEAEGLLRAGRAFLYEAVAGAWETAQQGQRLTWDERGLLWLAATQAAGQASQAVDLMFRAGGASSIYATSPLERCLRDIRTAAQHITVTPTNYEIAGQLFLGTPMGSTAWAFDSRNDAPDP